MLQRVTERMFYGVPTLSGYQLGKYLKGWLWFLEESVSDSYTLKRSQFINENRYSYPHTSRKLAKSKRKIWIWGMDTIRSS